MTQELFPIVHNKNTVEEQGVERKEKRRKWSEKVTVIGVGRKDTGKKKKIKVKWNKRRG